MSIVPSRGKRKRLIVLPSYKMKDVDVSSSRINTVTISTRNISQVERALTECRSELKVLREYKHKDLNYEWKQQLQHQELIIAKHRLFCVQKNTEIMFTVCKARRSRKECPRLCGSAKDFVGR